MQCDATGQSEYLYIFAFIHCVIGLKIKQKKNFNEISFILPRLMTMKKLFNAFAARSEF